MACKCRRFGLEQPRLLLVRVGEHLGAGVLKEKGHPVREDYLRHSSPHFLSS